MKFICKGGWQSLVLYVNQPISWPPVDGLTPDFACREQMGLTFQRKFFWVNSFWSAWGKIASSYVFLRQETSNITILMNPSCKLQVFGLKNIGRGNFTSCQPKRVNSKKNCLWNINPICSLHAKSGVNLSTGGQVMGWFTYKTRLCHPPLVSAPGPG